MITLDMIIQVRTTSENATARKALEQRVRHSV